MEPLESPRVEQVGGILSRGEDTDGERTDDEVDFPSSTSYVSRYEEDENEQQQDSAEELEVTGEGTSGGPFGLKKVLFVRKKSDKGMSSKDEPSFKDRFSKLGAGVGERFAAFGNIIQEHGSKNVAAGAAATSKVAESFSAADQTGETAQVSPRGYGASSAANPSDQNSNQGGMEYFREYEVTFSARPGFSLVPGAGGKGAVVSWDDSRPSASPAASPAAAAAAASPGAAVAPETFGEASSSVDTAVHVPPSGAALIAISGESVADRDVAAVAALLGVDSDGGGGGDGMVEHGGSSAPGSREKEDAETQPSSDSGKLSLEVPPDSAGGLYPVVVRFREKMKRQSDTGGGGGEVFRNRMKAMATGLGNLFQGKDAAVSSAARDGSGGAVAAAIPDAFVLTFSSGSSGTMDELPFTMVEGAGGLGVIVAAVREDYAESLVTPEEAGMVSAATAGVVPSEVAAAAAAAAGGGAEDGGAAAAALAPGALVLRVAGQNVEGKSLERVRKAVETAAADHSAVKFLFKRAPAIYRASVAAELALEQSKVPQVHVGTWQPLLKRRAGVTLGGGAAENGVGGGGGGGVIGLGYGGEEWEDVQTTMARAHRFINGFRSVGIRVRILSMQTVTLPRNVKSAYAGVFEGRLSSAFQQAVRLWFSFPDERTVSVQRQPTLEKLGLVHVDNGGSGGGGGGGAGGLGSWVTVTAADASPCSDAGVPVGEASILTHVNGFDVSPAAYRSLAPRAFGDGEGWAAAVLPALESGGGDKVSLTLV